MTETKYDFLIFQIRLWLGISRSQVQEITPSLAELLPTMMHAGRYFDPTVCDSYGVLCHPQLMPSRINLNPARGLSFQNSAWMRRGIKSQATVDLIVLYRILERQDGIVLSLACLGSLHCKHRKPN